MIDFNRLKTIFCYSSLTKEEFHIISEDLRKRNVILCVILSGMSFFTMAAMYLYSFVFSEWSSHRNIYAYYSVVFLIVYLISYMNKQRNVLSPLWTMYPFLFAFFSFTAIDSIMHTPDSVAVEPIVGLFLLSALFYFSLIKILFLITIITIVNSILAFIYCIEDVKMVNVSNFVIYGILLFILAHFLNKTMVTGVLNAHKAAIAGYTDLMTGLNNRNRYNTLLPYLGELATKNIACIYVDANDLHSLNNRLGHEAGDRMLVFIGSVLKQMFGSDFSFRVGGDEFVAFLVDFEEDVDKKCEIFKKRIIEEGYHVSIGSEVCDNINLLKMEQLVRTAESRMYEDKRIYYQEKGRNRRRVKED